MEVAVTKDMKSRFLVGITKGARSISDDVVFSKKITSR